MKKIIVILIVLVCSTFFLKGQAPKWINYLNCDWVNSIAFKDQYLWAV